MAGLKEGTRRSGVIAASGGGVSADSAGAEAVPD
jgi:hypothetical protein